MQLYNFHCCMFMFVVTLPHISGRVLWFHFGRLCIHPIVVRPSVFLLLDNSLSKYQWIFTKLGMCINVEILFGIINGQILSIFELSARQMIVVGNYCFMFYIDMILYLNTQCWWGVISFSLSTYLYIRPSFHLLNVHYNLFITWFIMTQFKDG